MKIRCSKLTQITGQSRVTFDTHQIRYNESAAAMSSDLPETGLEGTAQQDQDQITDPTICHLCNNLRPPTNQPSFRKVTLEGVDESAKRGCTSCSLISSGITEFCNSLLPVHRALNASLANPQIEIIWQYSRLSITALFKDADHRYITPRIELFSPAGSLTWPAIQRSADIPNKLDVSYVVKKARSWIDNCQDKHPYCKLPESPTLPTRIIHVGYQENYDDIRLGSSQELSDRYVALSYCWGNPQGMIRTTKSSISSWTIGIPWDQLPKTFQDAIKITRALGIPYLWIDALCILQDDVHDWELESANMARTYSNSYLTISATAASDSHAGLFLGRWTKSISEKSMKFPVQGLSLPGVNNAEMLVRHRIDLGHSRFRNVENADDHIEDAPLLTRAWAFQERLLPSHTLHFHVEEPMWECKSAIQFGELQKMESATQIGLMWLDLVSEFSSLRLTHESDRLAALSGLASAFSGKVLGTYMAGIWEHDIARGLLFECVSLDYKNDDLLAIQMTAPSWSWASMHLSGAKKVSYNTVLQYGLIQDHNFRLEGVFLTLNASNPLSWVSQGLLQIQGSCTLGLITPQTSTQESEFFIEVRGMKNSISQEHLFLDSLSEDLRNVSLFCMLVGRQEHSDNISEYILLLRKVDDELNKYRRVGILITSRSNFSIGGEPVLKVLLA